MLDPNLLDEMLTKGTGRANNAPWVGLGNFELTLKRFKKKVKKSMQTFIVGGVPQTVEAEQITGYIVEARVDASTSAKHKVGTDVAIYFRADEPKEHYRKNDEKDLFDFVRAFYDGLGTSIVVGPTATAEARAQAKTLVEAFLLNEYACRGGKIALSTKLPKSTDKDGNPKAKAPSEDGYLFKSWGPIKQTPEQFVANRDALGPTAER